jgi:hypothetical protein
MNDAFLTLLNLIIVTVLVLWVFLAANWFAYATNRKWRLGGRTLLIAVPVAWVATVAFTTLFPAVN